MDKLVKLKTDCVRQLSFNKENERKFRFGVGFIGFITTSKEKTISEIFKELMSRAYYKKNDVDVLLYIFRIMEIPECEKLVEKYKQEMGLGTSAPPAPVTPPSTRSLTGETIGDAELFMIRDKIPIGKLEEFAVRGLGMSLVEFENITAGHRAHDKILRVLKEWRSRAPIDGGASGMCPFSYGGLRMALEKAELNAVISDLGLNNMK